MHVKDIKATVSRVKAVSVGVGGFIGRHKRASIAVGAALLLAGPLVTGDGELVFLNAVGLGLGALLLRRFARPNGRQRTGRTQQEQRQQATRGAPATGATPARQAARATQHEGGHDDDASNDDWWDWDKATAKPGRAGRPADGGAVQG